MPRKTSPSYQTEGSVFATRLREIMKERGENQTTLADKISDEYVKIQRQTISLYMNGQSKPDTERLTAIAKVLDISADYLLGINNVKSQNGELQQVCKYIGLSEGAIEFLKYIGNDPNSEEKDIMPLVLSLLLENYKFFQALSGLSMACRSAHRYDEPSDVVAIEKFKHDHWDEIRQLGAEIWPASSVSDMFIYQANGRFLDCMEEVRLRFMPRQQ